MNKNWFLTLNVLLVGAMSLMIFLYAIILIRKRLKDGYLHIAGKKIKNKLLHRLFGVQPPTD